jgi:DNA mismatch repair protein MSH5
MCTDVMQHGQLLYSLSGLAAQLDALIALTLAAENYRMCRPEIREGGSTNIVRGRHILQEMTVDTFIPNDTDIGPSSGLVKLITGPNYSGKSVYMKQ